MSDHFARAIAQARREPAPTLVEALSIITSQERTIEVLTERLAKREELIHYLNGVDEYADRREITGPPVRDADMAAFMGAVEWQAPGADDPQAELVLLAGALAGGALIILVGLLVFSWVAEWIFA